MYRSPTRIAALVSVLAACQGASGDPRTRSAPTLAIAPWMDGFAAPIALVDDGAGHTYVVDRAGLVTAFGPPTQAAAAPFADLRDRLVPLGPGDPRGLAGFAFHPDYPADPLVFAWFAVPGQGLPPGYDHANRLSSFTVVDGRVDVDSEAILLELPHPGRDHNGVGPVFGPNGLLYLAIGDGGGRGDTGLGHPPGGNGQDRATLLGALLRLDVDGAAPYAIPADNPFASGGGAPEIHAYGFRDPTSLVFDPWTGELYLSDRGQALLDEVNVVHRGGNYGWNLREGTICFNPQAPEDPPISCPDEGADEAPLEPPVWSFPRPGSAIRGDGDAGEGVEGEGVVPGQPVRTDRLPGFDGHYLFGAAHGPEGDDEGEGEGVLFLGIQGRDGWRAKRVAIRGVPVPGEPLLGDPLLGVAADSDGDLYVLTTDEAGAAGDGGRILRVLAVEE